MIIICVVSILIKTIRNSISDTIKCLCSKIIIISLIILAAYSVMIIISVMSLFSMAGIWRTEYIKVISIWTLFVGIPMCFIAVITPLEKGCFKKIIIEGFSFTVLVGYLTGLFSFNLIIELILIPIISFVVIIHTYSKSKDEYKGTTKIMSIILAIIVFWVLIFTLEMAIENYSTLNSTDILVGFLLPIALLILYIPVAYLFGIYGKYDDIFAQMYNNGQINKNNKPNHKKDVFLACGLSYKKLSRFEKYYIKEMYSGMGENEFNQLIEKFKTV